MWVSKPKAVNVGVQTQSSKRWVSKPKEVKVGVQTQSSKRWVSKPKAVKGRGPLAKGDRNRGAAAVRGWERWFSPLDTATTAREGSGEGFGRRRCFAVVHRDLTGA
ncbi:hypothetical protein CRG98_026896 [Punica granatum]|uniref:Uncharacterized protein n=1 Tax=Punica granatum TaxID=22663 RepID=A0A2I0J8Z6_PUNGR|nr:hypothetical protein CRG98_026896 [Punica granatum]